MDQNVLRDSQSWLVMMRLSCTRLCAAANSSLSKAGLNMPQYNALSILKEKSEITMSALSRELGVTMGAGTNLMDRLVDAGYAERRRSGSDRRVVKVALTDKGTEILDRNTAALIEFWSGVMGQVDPGDRVKFLETYRKVFDLAEKAGGKKRPNPTPCPE